jgi:hypothetical protein
LAVVRSMMLAAPTSHSSSSSGSSDVGVGDSLGCSVGVVVGVSVVTPSFLLHPASDPIPAVRLARTVRRRIVPCFQAADKHLLEGLRAVLPAAGERSASSGSHPGGGMAFPLAQHSSDGTELRRFQPDPSRDLTMGSLAARRIRAPRLSMNRPSPLVTCTW